MLTNITFSAEESSIAAARAVAKQEKISLNDMFREWLERFKRIDSRSRKLQEEEFDALMERMSHIKIGKMPTREERNAR